MTRWIAYEQPYRDDRGRDWLECWIRLADDIALKRRRRAWRSTARRPK